jgi:hypothetical protein
MKKVILTFFIGMAVFAGNAQSCSSDLFRYSGPKNTQELINQLENDLSPAIQALSDEVKASLIEYMVFRDQRFIGYKEKDTRIKTMYENGSMKPVLEAILKMEVNIFSAEDRPEITFMTLTEFYAEFGGNPINAKFRSTAVDCFNCRMPQSTSERCCVVGGSGCCDVYIAFNDLYISINADL